MPQLQFTTKIKATKQKVWETLWNDKTFRDWASIIDEGTYMEGEIIEGQTVRFISSVSGYGVTSLVEKLVSYEFVLLKHMADTKDNGKNTREKEWTGGTESYSLIEQDGFTTLTIKTEVPKELEKIFLESMPKALEMIRELGEE